jgi:predicted HAD superfamily Cof-like phosphohydrolase
MYPRFELDIQEMNQRYKLDAIDVSSWLAVVKRLDQFKDILDKEFTELGDIAILADTADDSNWGTPGEHGQLPVKVVVQMADLLGDIVVYCASEAMRWGIPLPAILMIIMASNTSKLGADGKPIINPENGKFEKGPFYWKPEPAIEYLMTHEDSHSLVFKRNEHGVITYEIKEPQEGEVGTDTNPPVTQSTVVATEHPAGVMALDESESKGLGIVNFPHGEQK